MSRSPLVSGTCLVLFLLIPAALLCSRPGIGHAKPSVIYNGFGAADRFNSTARLAFGRAIVNGRPVTTELAVPFTVPSTGDHHLHAVDLAVTSEHGTRTIEVRLMGSAPSPAGGPDENLVLERMEATVSSSQQYAGPPGSHSIVHLASSEGPAIRAGARYWLAISASRPGPETILYWWGADAETRTGRSTPLGRRINLGPWRVTPGTPPGQAVRIWASPVPQPVQMSYIFTTIADTRGPYSRFPHPALVSLNDAGHVLFRAELDTGGLGIFLRTGGSVVSIAGTGGAAAEFASVGLYPSLNSSGAVAWRGSLREGTEGLFIRSGRAYEPVVLADGSFHSFGSPALNAAGAIAFLAGLRGQGGGIFIANAGRVSMAAHTRGAFDGFLEHLSLNRKGTVAFAARRDSGAYGIYTRREQTTTLIADTTGAFTALRYPHINDRGTVAFFACFDEEQPDCPRRSASAQGLFLGNGGPLTTIADSHGVFAAFGRPALNNAGQVAFAARLDSGMQGIFTGGNARSDKVIATGDRLHDAHVIEAGFMDGIGLNDAGQIAFYARSDDGTEGIYVATPRTPS